MVWLSSQGWISLLYDVIWWQCTSNTLHISLLLVATTLSISALCFCYLYGSLLLENQKISQTYFPSLLISLSYKSRTSSYSHWRTEEWRHSEKWFVYDSWWSKKKQHTSTEILVGSQTRWPCLNQIELSEIKTFCSTQHDVIYALK